MKALALTLAAVGLAASAFAADWPKSEAAVRAAYAKHQTAAQTCADEKAKLAKMKNPLYRASHSGPMQQACMNEQFEKGNLAKACQAAAPDSKGDKARAKLIADDCAGLPLTAPPPPKPPTPEEQAQQKWHGTQYQLQQDAKDLSFHQSECKEGVGGLLTAEQRKAKQKEACQLVKSSALVLKGNCDQELRTADSQEHKDWIKNFCEGALPK